MNGPASAEFDARAGRVRVELGGQLDLGWCHDAPNVFFH